MALYGEAKNFKNAMIKLIREEIKNSPEVKSAIKARKAVVTTPPSDETGNKVGVKLMQDNTELFLPYNSRFSASDLTADKVVSVWYYQTLTNAIVMQDGAWSL